jgi:hypothetical protein
MGLLDVLVALAEVCEPGVLPPPDAKRVLRRNRRPAAPRAVAGVAAAVTAARGAGGKCEGWLQKKEQRKQAAAGLSVTFATGSSSEGSVPGGGYGLGLSEVEVRATLGALALAASVDCVGTAQRLGPSKLGALLALCELDPEEGALNGVSGRSEAVREAAALALCHLAGAASAAASTKGRAALLRCSARDGAAAAQEGQAACAAFVDGGHAVERLDKERNSEDTWAVILHGPHLILMLFFEDPLKFKCF